MSGKGGVHLVGIGGSGMSSLAVVLAGRGVRVSGSDRDCDRGENAELFRALADHGIDLYPQDGSGVAAGPCEVVASGAVEASIPDLQAAREARIPILHRSELLARVASSARGIAVAGTSGKSTVTAMIAWILRDAGMSPTFLGGAPLVGGAARPEGVRPGPAAWCGEGEWLVFEADESDGSLTRYRPEVAVITNLSEDHLPLAQLREMFQTLADGTSRCVLLHYDRVSVWSRGAKNLTFGLSPAAGTFASDVVVGAGGSTFRSGGVDFRVALPGRFNVENALAAVATARALGIGWQVCADSLAGFPGVSRRMERVGESGGVLVIDDFAHNPDKVTSALEALRPEGGRLRVVFQLHGFAPARMHRAELVRAFREGLQDGDRLYLPPIYYVGGTVVRDVAAADYARDLREGGVDARQVDRSPELPRRVAADCRSGDIAVVMGARDPSLPALARDILAALPAER